MLKANIKYGLEGAFKVDTFDRDGNFVETTDWFSNFITQTGLMYPSIYSFPNCFRFLTIGNSQAFNTGASISIENATTGCYSPISSYYAGTAESPQLQDGRWIGHHAYETGTIPQNSSCSTSANGFNTIFYRAWGIPTGGGVILSGANPGETTLTIQEFAVSPSSGGTVGASAFSRIVRPFVLPQGYRAVVSYQLKVNHTNSSLTLMPSGTFETGNANVDDDGDMIREWRYLSGQYKQVWAGLSCVDNWGVSFISKYGNFMEPSLFNLNDYYLYFSPDNAEFDVNPTSGGFQTNTTQAWASCGVMSPIAPQNLSETSRTFGNEASQRDLFYGTEQTLSTIPTVSTPLNIRLGSATVPLNTVSLKGYTGSMKVGGYLDTSFNYQKNNQSVNASLETISYANPGGSGIRDGENGSLNRGPYYHERAIFSSRIYKLPMDATLHTGNQYAGRTKTITRKAVFSPAKNLGYNTRFGSMVLAYKDPSSTTVENYSFYPTIDCLFYDTSGRAQLQHYRQISGIYLTERGSGIINAQLDIVYEDGSVAGSNITRHVSLKTFQGPIVNGQPGPMTGFMSASSFLTGNIWTGVTSSLFGSGNLDYNSPTLGYSGWGSIYGTIDPLYNNGSKPYDIGIADHNTGITTDNHTGKLYWPSVFGKALSGKFSNIIFSGCTVGATPLTYTDQDDTTLASQGFKLPSGVILHYDNIGVTGYRLLPNYGVGNTTNTNTYLPGYGGTLPGLSMDNGLEVYFDISWSSPCGSATNDCFAPV